MSDRDWAPLTHAFADVWEIQTDWVDENCEKVQVLDVREPSEFTGPLGHIRGARLIPLGELPGRADELARDKPVVVVCLSGGRSAQATSFLQQLGFDRVANLAGGMQRWRMQGRSVER